jgi:hypothetical protein
MKEPMATPSGLVIKLRADWGAGPLWVSVGDEIPDPYDAEEISEVAQLSAELLYDIAMWDERFQASYNDATPQDSGIRDAAERAAFIEDGRNLARRLKAEVPNSTQVGYVPMDTGVWETI